MLQGREYERRKQQLNRKIEKLNSGHGVVAAAEAADGHREEKQLRQQRQQRQQQQQQPLQPEVAALSAENERNQERLVQGLREGLAELLELHNSDELRSLCASLELRGANSKKANLALVLDSVQEGREEKECRRILNAVWDGIIIEYLRKCGKNLLKCRDNLRGAVMSHWKRHAVAIAARAVEDEASNLPVYMRHTVWRRGNPTSDKDLRVNEFLETLHGAEMELKGAESAMRVRGDYANVVSFLSSIHKVRNIEGSFRSSILAMVQELLGERDIVRENERQAVARANEAEAAMEAMVKRERGVSFFRGINDALQRDRLLENIRTQVELVHRETDIVNLKEDMAEQKRRHLIREGQLLMRIEELEETLRATRESLWMTNENLVQSQVELKEKMERLARTEALFKAYRRDAQAFVTETTKRGAIEEVEALLTFKVAACNAARVTELEGELATALRATTAQREENARLQMHICEVESAALQDDEEGGGRAGSSASKTGKKKKKSASPTRGRSKTRKGAAGKKSKSPKKKSKSPKRKSGGKSPKATSPKSKSPKSKSPKSKSPKNKSPKSKSPKNKSPKSKSPKSKSPKSPSSGGDMAAAEAEAAEAPRKKSGAKTKRRRGKAKSDAGSKSSGSDASELDLSEPELVTVDNA